MDILDGDAVLVFVHTRCGDLAADDLAENGVRHAGYLVGETGGHCLIKDPPP
jgi:hypothetical protein